ncbi:MAG: hypothetical protein DRH70_01235 [Candidatus Coatesbacteria bacterium]|nr:MAG: hypothetical protein DRH70_01235 [Candidatus Coatesbacteria bacterium]
MSLIRAVLFGTLQGLTEFLPVSSSGHLAVFHKLFGAAVKSMVPMGVIAHVGTLLAVLIYFRKDLLMFVRVLSPKALSSVARRPSQLFVAQPPQDEHAKLSYQRILAMIVVGTLPAAVIGFAFKGTIERAFASVKLIGVMFLVTGIVLLLTRLRQQGERTVWHAWLLSALLIGTAQALAITPGISRSGFTIAAGIFLGLRRDFAARFSFLLSIPAIAGAFVLEFGDIARALTTQGAAEMLLIFLAAFAVGYVSIAVLLRIVSRGRLHLFGFYCLAAGILTLCLV